MPRAKSDNNRQLLEVSGPCLQLFLFPQNFNRKGATDVLEKAEFSAPAIAHKQCLFYTSVLVFYVGAAV